MDHPGPEVVDISSDSDDDGCSLNKNPVDDESYNWIDELLVDKETAECGGDNYIDLDQFVCRKESYGDDDDCLILDGDPDKVVAVSEDCKVGDGGDELCIVGEKGQIACRDYPHSRHLCANLPFSTTSHEKHCNMCHCYVCDSLAPCLFWGNGGSSSDHCHATENDETWKLQRRFLKKRNIETLPLQKLPHTTLPTVHNPQPICFPNRHPVPAQPSRSHPLRPCSATSNAIPYSPNQRYRQQPDAYNYRQHVTKSQSLVPGMRCVQKERGSDALTRLTIHSQSKFKRVGSYGSGFISSSTQRSQHAAPFPNQMHRTLPQKPQNIPQKPQHVPQEPQYVPQKPQYPLIISLKSQHLPVTSKRTQDISLTDAGDSTTEWRDVLASMASELGVEDSISTSTTRIQPCTVSSQHAPFINEIIHQGNSGQHIVPNSTSGPATFPSNLLDSSCDLLDSAAAENFPEQGQGGNPLLAAVHPSDPVVPMSSSMAGEINVDSLLAAAEDQITAENRNLIDMTNLLFSDFDYSFGVP